ncbi:hypothetical protein [Micromonospora sp. NBC_01796]|uniref:hypothetical protein n=1 Tax=Micromonospora sp. NBC_01796 TaxID=2975987 RepID=UPI002DD8047D|nr:hypothetical protein [Micromonospora sp. NBC_01796]WSA84499.1 hypothetical protein OIE47_29700 [Micromonospora sp. NBC_01796]
MTGWPTVIGTLGGVAVTALLGLVTAYLTHRWQQERVRQEQQIVSHRELRAARRDVYARYLVSAQHAFDAAKAQYLANRDQPRDPAEFTTDPPEEMRVAIAANEALRVEVMLLAGEPLRAALEAYDRGLWRLWPVLGSGNDRSFQSDSTRRYHRLVQAMHDEVTGTH